MRLNVFVSLIRVASVTCSFVLARFASLPLAAKRSCNVVPTSDKVRTDADPTRELLAVQGGVKRAQGSNLGAGYDRPLNSIPRRNLSPVRASDVPRSAIHSFKMEQPT